MKKLTFENEIKKRDEFTPVTNNVNTNITKTSVQSYQIIKSLITINPEYSSLVYSLSKSEYELLKNSISNKGLHLPIIVNQNNAILDGHHRYKICKELNIEPRFEAKRFDDPLDEKEFVIEINAQRRQLNDFQKAELAYKLEDLYKEQARLRRLSKLKNVKDRLPLSVSLGSNDHNDNDNSNTKEEVKGRTSEVVSKKNDLSPKTYQRARTIIENGSEEVKEKLRQGKTKISKEYEKIQRDRKRQNYYLKLILKTAKNEKKKQIIAN